MPAATARHAAAQNQRATSKGRQPIKTHIERFCFDHCADAASDFDQAARHPVMIAEPNKRDVQAFCLKQFSSQPELPAPGGGPADKRGGDRVFNKNGKKQQVVPMPIQLFPAEEGLAIFPNSELRQLVHSYPVRQFTPEKF